MKFVDANENVWYSLVFLLIFLVSNCITIDTSRGDVDLYGSTLASGDRLIVMMKNRTNALFYISFADNSNQFCQIDTNYLFNSEKYVLQITAPRSGTPMNDVFFYMVYYTVSATNSISIVRVQVYSSYCGHTSVLFDPWTYTPDFLQVLGAHKQRDIAFGQEQNLIHEINFGNGIYANRSNIPLGNDWIDNPYACDTSFDGLWAVIAGEKLNNGMYVPTLYLISCPTMNGNYSIIDDWSVPIVYNWQLRRLASNTYVDDYNVINATSVAVNQLGEILFGVQTLNTVYHLRVDINSSPHFTLISSRCNGRLVPGIGFGKNVAWLDDKTAVILANNVSFDYSQWFSSRIEIYDLTGGKQLDDYQNPYSYFPNKNQPLPQVMSEQLILMAASSYGSISVTDAKGVVYVIYPSGGDSYADTKTNYSLVGNVYSSVMMSCPEGTGRDSFSGLKTIFDYCSPCLENFYFGIASNGIMGCLPCNLSESFCPIGAMAPIPLSYLKPRSQATRFSQSKEIGAFDDILLYNMFNNNFNGKCLVTAPMFWTYLMLVLASFSIFLILILRYTGKCLIFQQTLQSIFVHFDIISDGERWIGGIFSFSILIMIIYAALFTKSFLQQYPLSKSTKTDFTCDQSLRNSEFSSQMQPLGNLMYRKTRNIFHLLTEQPMKISVLFLSSVSNRSVIVQETIGSRSETLACNRSQPTLGVIQVTCGLSESTPRLIYNISTWKYIGALQISLTAPALTENNFEIQAMNFSSTFRKQNHLVAFQSLYTLELTPVVNETRALSSTEQSKYSAIWLPLVKKDDVQNFLTLNDYQQYEQDFIVLNIQFTYSNFYISNQEKPVVKMNRAIFKNVLFASTCMELFSFAFLLMKLIVLPLVHMLIRKIFSKKDGNPEKQNENYDDDESNEKEKPKEDEDDDDDDDFDATSKQLEPAVNDWYTPGKRF